MRITVLAVGRAKRSPEAEMVGDFRTRFSGLARPLGFRAFDLVEIEPARASSSASAKAQEAERLRAALPGAARVVALDEHGKALGSVAFSDRLARWRDDGVQDCAFLIGGADGLDPGLLKAADMTLAFGPATWPHMMVRAMLAEQIYRAATILANHPYHRA